MSALDLFASALGAFIVISIILFPYYNSKAEAEEKLEQLEEELEVTKIEAENRRKKATESMKPLGAKETIPTLLQQAQEEVQEIEAEIQQEEMKIAALRKEAERRVPFALLGINSTANSFVFVIDMSGSMIEYQPILNRALDNMIDPLRGHNRFSVIGYQGFEDLHRWPLDAKPVRATQVNRNKAKQFIKRMFFCCATPTLVGLEAALDVKAEAIILVTDGEPNTWPASDIVTKVTAANAGKKEIHTVAVGAYAANAIGVDFLKSLARKNKGHFVGLTR